MKKGYNFKKGDWIKLCVESIGVRYLEIYDVQLSKISKYELVISTNIYYLVYNVFTGWDFSSIAGFRYAKLICD